MILGDVTDLYIIVGSDGATRGIGHGKWSDKGSRKEIMDAPAAAPLSRIEAVGGYLRQAARDGEVVSFSGRWCIWPLLHGRPERQLEPR